MTEVKICGLRSEKDIIAARGAVYHGFVINTGTRRSLTLPEAKALMEATDALPVAVTTSNDPKALRHIAVELHPYALQLNGPVDKDVVRALREATDCDVWMAVHVGNELPVLDLELLGKVDCVVLDTASPDGGGSGVTHDHGLSRQIAHMIGGRISLAGGLTPQNVRGAIDAVRPNIVDVSSGVESDGAKDPEKIREFVERVRECQ